MQMMTWNELLNNDPGLGLVTSIEDRISGWSLFLKENSSGIPLCLDWNWARLDTHQGIQGNYRRYVYEEQAFGGLLVFRDPKTFTIYSLGNLTALLLPITFKEYVDLVFDKLNYEHWQSIQHFLRFDANPDNHVSWDYVCGKMDVLYDKGLPE